MKRFLIGDNLIYDAHASSSVQLGRRVVDPATGSVAVVLTLATGFETTLGGAAADALWRVLRDGAAKVPVADVSKPSPIPVDPDRPASHVAPPADGILAQTVETAVRMMAPQGTGDAIVVNMKGLERIVVRFTASAPGDDVFFFGLNPGRQWVIAKDGVAPFPLNHHGLGMAWTFAKGGSETTILLDSFAPMF